MKFTISIKIETTVQAVGTADSTYIVKRVLVTPWFTKRLTCYRYMFVQKELNFYFVPCPSILGCLPLVVPCPKDRVYKMGFWVRLWGDKRVKLPELEAINETYDYMSPKTLN